jgi:hypothetical protein
MPAFDAITAADFEEIASDYFVIEGLHLQEEWYNAAGELYTEVIDALRDRVANHSTAENGDLDSNGTERGALSELTRTLQSLSSINNRDRILQLRGPHARVILNAIQTVCIQLNHFMPCLTTTSG